MRGKNYKNKKEKKMIWKVSKSKKLFFGKQIAKKQQLTKNAIRRNGTQDLCLGVHTILIRTRPDRGSTAKRPNQGLQGSVHLKDHVCNRTAINRLNRPALHPTSEPGGSMRTGEVLSFSKITPLCIQVDLIQLGVLLEIGVQGCLLSLEPWIDRVGALD